MKRVPSISILLLVMLIAGCDIYEQDDYQELVVLEAYAVANRPLPNVRLSRTMPLTEEYSFQNAAISDGVVRVTRLDGNGADQEIYFYERASAGVYRAIDRDYLVEPGASYRIDIEFENRPEILTSVTTIPLQFEILSEVAESYVYQSDDQLEIRLSATASSARQNVYVFNTLTQEPSIDNLTPFYRNSVVEGDSEVSDFLSNASGLINEGNFEIGEDNTILLRFPWIGVAFFGENLVVTNSVDQNLADLVRSEELQLGGSTLPPGEIPNLIYNVEGGIGVFGSLSSDTVTTRFLRPEF